MKFTKSTKFALRVLVYLAAQKESVTMPQLAEQLSIPYNHLSKLVQTLNRAGFIKTRQGKFGGIEINTSPQQISLKDVVTITDGPVNFSECTDNDLQNCHCFSNCKLQGVFHTLQSDIEHSLERVKIADMV